FLRGKVQLLVRSQWVILVVLSALLGGIARGGEWDRAAFSQECKTQGMRAWLVLPTRMVTDDADLPASDSPQPFELRAGRNEYECAQLVVMLAKQIDNASVEFSDFTSDDHAIVAAANFAANKIGEVPGRI